MQDRGDEPEPAREQGRQGEWFEYAVTVGRLTARPIHPLGWLALMACVAVSVVLGLVVGRPLLRINLFLGIGGMGATTLLPLLLFFRLVVTKGRRKY